MPGRPVRGGAGALVRAYRRLLLHSPRPPAEAWGVLPDPPEPPCAGRTRLFFSSSPVERRRAQALCGTCPYARSCAELAVRRGEHAGVWGGLDFGRIADRRAARSRPTLRAG